MIGSRRQDAPKDIDVLVRMLHVTRNELTGLRRKHGDGLIAVLQARWYETRDRPRLLHRSSELGYTAEPAMAVDHEPEAVRKEDQERFSVEARARMADLKSEEVARANSRSQIARLRQVERDATRKGVDALPYLAVIESQIRAMEEALKDAA